MRRAPSWEPAAAEWAGTDAAAISSPPAPKAPEVEVTAGRSVVPRAREGVPGTGRRREARGRAAAADPPRSTQVAAGGWAGGAEEGGAEAPGPVRPAGWAAAAAAGDSAWGRREGRSA